MGATRFRSVPQFFFHVYDDSVSLDEEGQELPTVDAARERAVMEARGLASREVLEGHLGLTHRIEVEDAAGAPVVTVEFKDVIQLHP